MTKPLRVLGWPAFANRREQPYTSLLYENMDAHVAEASAARIASGSYDILHLHWPDRRVCDSSAARAVARSAGMIALLDLAHARGMKVVWTVHNLSAHEGAHRPWLERRYWDALTQRLDAFIAMTPSGVAAARARYPALAHKRAFVIPHPHYRGVYPDTVGSAEARNRLGIAPGAHVIAFAGQVREYKNVPHLLTAFAGLDDSGAVLLVAGKPKPAALGDDLSATAASDPRIRLDLRFIRDDELQVTLRAADLVVLPYREILNSGSALLALSFDRPILVPDRGAMAELNASIGGQWVRTYTGILTTAILRDALQWATMPGRPIQPDLSGLDRKAVAKQTADAFVEIARFP